MMKSTFAPARLAAPAALIIGFVAAALALSAALNISPDEWNSLRTTSRGLGFAYSTGTGYEALPPIYPLLLDVWRGISPKIQFARLLSILAAAGTIAIAYRFALRRTSALSPFVFALAVAVAPFAVFAAVEIRLYALAICLSAALALTFLDGFVDERLARNARIAHVVLVALAPYLQYYIAAQVLGELVALLVMRRGRALRDAIPYAIGIVAWLPAIALARTQIGVYDEGSTISQQVHGLVITFGSFLVPNEWRGLFPAYTWTIYLALALVALAFASLCATRAKLDDDLIAQAIVVATIVAFFLAVPIVLHKTIAYPRHIATLFFPSLALAAMLVDRSIRAHSPLWRPVVVLYFGAALASLVATYSSFTKEGNYRRAAEYVMDHGLPGEPVFAFNLESVGPLQVYYRGSGPIHGLPQDQQFERWDRRSFAIRSTAQIRAALSGIAPGRRVWIYLGPDCFVAKVEERGGCGYLREVVAHDFTTVSSKRLTNVELLDLQRR